ncbi:ankyrin repeat, SAM and basic leucine zipper domain-containing protein 1 [Porphyrio hochstetteri]
MADVLWRRYLMAASAEDWDGDDDDDDDCWDIGVVRREPQPLDEILQGDKNEALKKALFSGDVFLIEELLNSGINIESSFHFGWTPLMCAASLADFTVVRLLLDRGANVCFEIDKYTVLMAACSANASEESILKTVELLLSRSADPNCACRRQMTPLMHAARKGYPLVAACLVAHGSHLNTQDENGYSALMWAAQHGHKSVIFTLLELGADKNLQNKDEKTAAEIAKIHQHLEIYTLLSLAAHHLQERSSGTVKQAIYKLCTSVSDHRAGSCSVFNDTGVFLHGLGLEHLKGILKEKGIGLRKLLIMQEAELMQAGITNPGDQRKLLDVIKELQVRRESLEEFSESMSGDELKFLQKLNEECSKLIVRVQTVNKHFLQNPHKVVLKWALTKKSSVEAYEDLVCSVEQLREEVARLKCLEKHEQKSDSSQVKLPEKAPTLEKRLVKVGAVTLLGFGFFFFVTKLVVKKHATQTLGIIF